MKGGHKTVCEGKKCSMCDYLTWKSKERKKKKKRQVTPILSTVTERIRLGEGKIKGST